MLFYGPRSDDQLNILCFKQKGLMNLKLFLFWSVRNGLSTSLKETDTVRSSYWPQKALLSLLHPIFMIQEDLEN